MTNESARYAGELLVRRLRSVVDLDRDDAAALMAVVTPSRTASPRRDIVREGAVPGAPLLIVSGCATQYRTLEDGRRQTLSLLVPGDICGLQAALLPQTDYAIGALRAVRYAELPANMFDRLAPRRPRLGDALWRQVLTSISVQREWTVSLGQRNSLERVGHLICEMYLRLRAVGQVYGQSCDFPLTQIDIAEATGLTQVHVNRTMRQLRVDGLIALNDRVMTIPDLKALMRASLFNTAYLHLRDDRVVDSRSTDPVGICV